MSTNVGKWKRNERRIQVQNTKGHEQKENVMVNGNKRILQQEDCEGEFKIEDGGICKKGKWSEDKDIISNFQVKVASLEWPQIDK